MADALLGGMMAAAATALGTLPVLFAQTLPQKVQDSLYGFGAGVMLAASAFSLVAPGIAAAGELGHGPWGAGILVGAAILLGAAVLLLMDRCLPHEHFIKGREGIEAHACAAPGCSCSPSRCTTCPKGWPSAWAMPATTAARRGASHRHRHPGHSRKGWWWRWR